jgi:hypothetical protein
VAPLPAVTFREDGVAATLKSGVTWFVHAVIALYTFNRPPVTVRPVNEGIWSTLASSTFLSVTVSSVQADSTSAAAPETCGVAIDVPL